MDHDDKCLPLVCAEVSLRELLLVRLIATFLGCRADHCDVPICNAGTTIPFGWVAVRFLEKCAAGLLRLFMRMHLVVCKLLLGLMLMSIAFLLSLLGSGCTAVHDLGFKTMEFFGCALQKTDVLGSR